MKDGSDRAQVKVTGNCGACSTSSHPLSRDPRRGKWRLVFIPGCQYFHSRRLASNRAPRGRAGAALDTAPSIPGCSKPWARWEVNSAEPARKPRGARHKNSIARVRNHSSGCWNHLQAGRPTPNWGRPAPYTRLPCPRATLGRAKTFHLSSDWRLEKRVSQAPEAPS
jgi:hypothetical protein